MGRERELEELPGRLRPSARRAGLPRGDGRRPGRDRQVAARAGARRRGRRRRHGGGRPLPVLRRGRHLPPAGRDRPAARGKRPAAAGRGAARRRRADRAAGPGRDRPVRRAPPRPRRRSGPSAGCSSGWPRERPLVVVVEDVHWAEPTLLDLLEYLVAFSSGHPILLVCLARPEFLETRPRWVAPQPEPVAAAARCRSRTRRRAQLVESAGADELGSGTAARIVGHGRGQPALPRAARGGGSGERRRRAAVEHPGGARRAHRPPRAAASAPCSSTPRSRAGASTSARSRSCCAEPDRAGIATHLVSLVQQAADPRGPVRRSRARTRSGSRTRSSERPRTRACPSSGAPSCTSGWRAGSRRWPDAQDETIGHHLAEAYRHLAELGLVGERERALARQRGGAARVAGGARAPARRSAGGRAAARARRVAPGAGRSGARARSCRARVPRCSRPAGWRTPTAFSPRRSTRAGGDRRLEARARVERAARAAPGRIRRADRGRRTGRGLRAERARGARRRARPVPRVVPAGLQAWVEGRCARRRRGLACAPPSTRAARATRRRCSRSWTGAPRRPCSAPRRCRRRSSRCRGDPRAGARQPGRGRPDAASRWRRCTRWPATSTRLAGSSTPATRSSASSAACTRRSRSRRRWSRCWPAEPAAAEARLRSGYERLEEMGEKALLATTAAMLAQAVYAQGRHDEAAESLPGERGGRGRGRPLGPGRVAGRAREAARRARAGRRRRRRSRGGGAARRADRLPHRSARMRSSTWARSSARAGARTRPTRRSARRSSSTGERAMSCRPSARGRASQPPPKGFSPIPDGLDRRPAGRGR